MAVLGTAVVGATEAAQHRTAAAGWRGHAALPWLLERAIAAHHGKGSPAAQKGLASPPQGAVLCVVRPRHPVLRLPPGWRQRSAGACRRGDALAGRWWLRSSLTVCAQMCLHILIHYVCSAHMNVAQGIDIAR